MGKSSDLKLVECLSAISAELPQWQVLLLSLFPPSLPTLVFSAVPVEKNTASAPAGLPKKDGQIEIKKHAAFQNDKRLNGDELKNLLLSDPESAMEYNKSKSTATIGFVAVGIGAAFGIYSGIASVSSSLKDIENISNGSKETSDPSSYLIPSLIATGCELIGIALLVNSNNQHKKSISIYNSKHTTGFNSDQKLELGITRDGIGITYHF
jgi:hypothetical protein